MTFAHKSILIFILISQISSASAFTKEFLIHWIYTGMALAYTKDSNKRKATTESLEVDAKEIVEKYYEDLIHNSQLDINIKIKGLVELGKERYMSNYYLNTTH